MRIVGRKVDDLCPCACDNILEFLVVVDRIVVTDKHTVLLWEWPHDWHLHRLACNEEQQLMQHL